MREMQDTVAQTSLLLKQAQKALQAGQFKKAAREVDVILVDNPNNQDGLYLAAVCARYMQDYATAWAHLSKLKTVLPDHGRAFQEEGHLRLAQAQPDMALTAFYNAARCNPSLTASWDAHAKLLRTAGRPAEAAQSEAQSARLKKLPRELLATLNHIHEGRILRAEEIARAFLQKQPHHTEGMRLLADIGSRLGVLEDADFLLETAIQLDPSNLQLRIDFIQVLRKRQKFAAALEQAKELLARDPNSPVFQSLYAIEAMQAGDYDTALAMFDDVLAALPQDPATLTSRGHALKTCGRTDDAIASYRSAVAANPLHGDAWYALANLKTYRFNGDEIAQMRSAQANTNLSHMSQIHIAFALGKAFEDQKDYDQSFQNYAAGNSLKSTQVRYTSTQMISEFEAQKQYGSKALFETRIGVGCSAVDPIFIVGLPRAGSTLIEQILASHSQVDGTLELPNILSLAHRLRGRKQITDRERYPRILHDMSAEELRILGEDYIENTRIHRRGAPFFTDKMPNNFRHIGLIQLILPNAKIIDARRNPMDCCWSGFKQLFAEGQEFTYSLSDIGEYFRAYVDLMDHWDRVLPTGRVLRVQHEELLNDVEGQVQRILAYCDLPFERACVDFHLTDRAVRTASSEQVRRPINKSGLDQWQPFADHLNPLKQALGSVLVPTG